MWHRKTVVSVRLPHRGNMGKKEVVDALEFRGGFALLKKSEAEAIITGYRDGLVKKDTLRVFAAMKEKDALHSKSKVDLSRITNSKSELKGVKRLRSGLIEKEKERLTSLLKTSPETKERRKCASRRALRAIAQGRLSCTESIVLLMYFAKRITQVKPLKRLEVGERYARFTFRELEELSGISRANISRAVASLKAKGFLSTVTVVKPNENQFGLLFVDGVLLTLIPGAAGKDRSKPPLPVRVHEKATPPLQFNNSPLIKSATLKKDYPKREILKNKLGSYSHVSKSEWERIQRRGELIKENLAGQAA
jgi:hypothetical protein